MSDLRKEVSDYIKEFKINELISFLSRMVLYFTPEDPVAFLRNLLLDLKTSAQDGNFVDIMYPDESLKAYFRLLDPAGEGFISWEQLKSALHTMGIQDVDLPIVKSGPVTEQVFLQMYQKNFERNITITREKD
ncbi:EF-hand calcium-binding domain-containing [Argiope bruennichi]|uniref:EF-hand calcium-binding domain-containing n=1 Tax=Argiope bruennichi TaxID=94029 RepID=A0A8T0EJD2_ARGBR|nr:EF-hand calcium-binding domain-containing [Argiope bruennichi]